MRSLALLAATFLLALPPEDARAEDGAVGHWQGTYACAQGQTGLTLMVRPAAGAGIKAVFYFHPVASNPAVPEGCFEMAGTFDPRIRRLDASAGAWLLRPFGFVAVDLSGTVSPDGRTLSGTVSGPLCTTLRLHRVSVRSKPAPDACRPADLVASVID